MQSSDVPSKSAKVFGQSATGTYIRTVPQTTADPAAASFDIGFPPQTFTDEGAGGTPPDGRDFNGILNFLTAWARWQSAGAPIAYDPTFQASVSGYPMGAVVASAVTLGIFWISTVENNMTNPDAGGAGWRKHALAGGMIGYRVFTASATYTPTPGTQSVEVTAIGAGGAGGGTAGMPGSNFAAGGGGGSGGWAVSRLTTGFAGVAITIGTGGAPNTGGNGGNGGDTTFGGAVTGGGGGGGAFGVPASIGSCQVGGAGGAAGGGNLYLTTGDGGSPGIAFTNGNMVSGKGGSTPWGVGGISRPTTTAAGVDGRLGGGGGGGGIARSGAGAQAGGAGGGGLCIVKEFA